MKKLSMMMTLAVMVMVVNVNCWGFQPTVVIQPQKKMSLNYMAQNSIRKDVWKTMIEHCFGHTVQILSKKYKENAWKKSSNSEVEKYVNELMDFFDSNVPKWYGAYLRFNPNEDPWNGFSEKEKNEILNVGIKYFIKN